MGCEADLAWSVLQVIGALLSKGLFGMVSER